MSSPFILLGLLNTLVSAVSLRGRVWVLQIAWPGGLSVNSFPLRQVLSQDSVYLTESARYHVSLCTLTIPGECQSTKPFLLFPSKSARP